MPRVYELIDLIENPSNPRAYFQDFENSLCEVPGKKQVWRAYEREFQRLNAGSWQHLKDEARPYLTTPDTKGRWWEQLISTLNQARGYNFLIDEGCSQVSFIPRAKVRGHKTPDLKGALKGQAVLCDVKTIHISDEELNKRITGSAGTTADFLHENFLNSSKPPCASAISRRSTSSSPRG